MAEPVSVVVPTIGRPRQLQACLKSLGACVPAPSEVLIIDQSQTNAVEDLVQAFSAVGARSIRCDGRGIARACNIGLENASGEFVAFTHDDCTVSVDWIKTASRLMSGDPAAIYTGSVLPHGDPWAVPSTIDDPQPHDYTGQKQCTVLYPSNMVCPRSSVLAFGAFDTRFVVAAEDNDLCYRWLRGGNRLLYEPSLRVWHHDWRSPRELRAVYRDYGRAQGAFYAKHLRQGDPRMLRFLAENILGSARATASAIVRRQPERLIAPWGVLRGLPGGLRRGWREFGPS
jgi:GT2 family glycosyltransferase